MSLPIYILHYYMMVLLPQEEGPHPLLKWALDLSPRFKQAKLSFDIEVMASLANLWLCMLEETVGCMWFKNMDARL